MLSTLTSKHPIDQFIRPSISSSNPDPPRVVAQYNSLRLLVLRLLELSILRYTLYVKTKPCLITASAVYLARHELGISSECISSGGFLRSSNDSTLQTSFARMEQRYWSKELEECTSYAIGDLNHTVKLIAGLQKNDRMKE